MVVWRWRGAAALRIRTPGRGGPSPGTPTPRSIPPASPRLHPHRSGVTGWVGW